MEFGDMVLRLLSWVILALAMSRCHGCLEAERLALLQIKASINHPNGISLFEWKDGNTGNCCDWLRVECHKATRSVIALDLLYIRQNELGDWCWNASLFRPFESLTRLLLLSNQLVICTDDEGVENQLSKLRNLEVLDLSFNKLDSRILLSINGLASLRSLDLSENYLNSSIHLKDSIGGFGNLSLNLKNLEVLDLTKNEVDNSILSSLHGLSSLRSLNLSFNNLGGSSHMRDSTGGFGNLSLNLRNLEELHLGSNQLDNSILSSLHGFSSLRSLDLSWNKLEGSSHMQGLCRLKTLQVLHLSYNNLEGNLPWCWPNLTSLEDIDLSSNQITGDIRDISSSGKSFLWLIENKTELVRLVLHNNSFTGPLQMPSNPNSKLTELDISSNHFSGNIPEDIGTSFPGLEDLTLSSNRFTGTIPSSFGDMASLVSLDLSHNFFSGNIPNSLAMGCSSLETLTLSNNSLQGSILPARHNLTQLTYLELDVNNFTTIPNSLSSCSELFRLKINLNHLDGPFPTAICQLKSLHYLDISENNITGILPACFSPDMEIVKLSKNRLQGQLPHAFFNCTRLEVLDLSHNQFTGPIPKWFDSLSGLWILLLNNNHFEGEIFSQFCHSPVLNLINLSNNNLSGGIPPCLGNITYRGDVTHRVFEAQFVPFVTKSIPLVYGEYFLEIFFAIDLSCNNLAGHIPPEIGRLFHLNSLNLSHNSLSGTIPITFANLTSTESLDLSYNRLTGSIPSQLAKLDSLEVFNVSFNNLSGPIPEGPHFQTFDGMSYVGNQFLCGKPISRNCTDPEPATVTPRTKKETEFMDMDIFYVSFTAAYITMLLGVFAILCINPYWRRAWFHLVEVSLSFCYYFVVENLP